MDELFEFFKNLDDQFQKDQMQGALMHIQTINHAKQVMRIMPDVSVVLSIGDVEITIDPESPSIKDMLEHEIEYAEDVISKIKP